MPLRVAFDLDGVLADMDGELVRQAKMLFGDALTQPPKQPAGAESPASPPAPVDATSGAEPPVEVAPDSVPPLLRLNMTTRQQRKLWAHVEAIENFWTTLEELEPGILVRLAALAAERRWEIIFLTKRPEGAGATSQVQTQRWLDSKGFPLPSVYVVQGSRGRIAAALALDFVVDDRPENCLDVAVDSKARAILVWRGDESELPATARRLGIAVVKSVADCLDILVQIDAKPRNEAGLIGRVMRLLGLDETTSA